MKKFDSYGLDICVLQAEVFERSLTMTQCSSPIFIRRFLNSDVATRMDKLGFLYESIDVTDILIEVEEQYGLSSYGKERYGKDALYWMGYIYRYLAYTYEKSSKQTYKMIKPTELYKLFYPYHSLDPAQAIERILEAKGYVEEDLIEKGVRIFREILAQEEKKKGQ